MRLNALFLSLLCTAALTSYSQTKFSYVYSTDSIEKGIELHDEENYEEAIKLYSYVLPGDTNYEWAVYEKCLSLATDTQYLEAIDLAEKGILFHNSNEGKFYNLLGSCYDELDSMELSIETYNKAIERFPMDHNLYFNRAVVYDKMDNPAEAYADLKRAVEINPYHSSSHLALAKLALNEEQYAQALLAFGFYLVIEPTGSRANSNLVFFNEAVSSKVDLNPRDLTFENESDFKKVNLLITSYAALRKDYKTPSDIDLPIIKQLHLAIDQATKIKTRKGFWENYYLPFYDLILNEEFFEPLSYRIISSSGNARHQKVIKKNTKSILAFVENIGPEIKDLYGLHHEGYVETNDKIKYWHYDNGASVEAIGNVNADNDPVGAYTFYYRSGSMLSQGEYNDKGEKNGKWTYYFPSGVVSGTNVFDNGILEGEDVDYYESGRKSVESAFTNDKRHGLTYAYNKTGDLDRTMFFKEGVINDSIVYYMVNGQVDYRLPMKEGLIDGKAFYYWADGSKSAEYLWLNDERDGAFEGYYADGTLSAKGTYKVGKLNGDYISYYSNGKVREEGSYVEGTKVGKWQEYYYDGKLRETAVYDEKGKTTGIRETYDYNGHKTTTFDYLKGEVTSYRHYDRNGNVVQEAKRKKGQFFYENLTLDGVVVAAGNYAGDHKEGEWKYYSDNGVLTVIEQFNDKGLLDGELKTYHINGQLKRHTTYVNDTLNGYDVTYYDNGQISEHGYNWNGKAYGVWKGYYKNGTLSEENFYVKGDYNGPQYWYNEAGELYLVEHFDMGLLNKMESCGADSVAYKTHVVEKPLGTTIRYYPNGQKIYEISVAGNQYNGPANWWYGTGQLSTQGQYLAGDRYGEWKSYHTNGKLKTEGNYAFGDKVGEWKDYYESGKLESIEKYENGNLHGELITCYEDGNVESKAKFFQGDWNGERYFYDYRGKVDHIRFYDQGRIIGYAYLDKSGEPLPMIPISKETEDVVSYFPNGKVSRQYQLKNGMFEGDYLEYNVDGSLRFKGTYLNDNRVGRCKTYYANGKIKLDGDYKDGYLHGESIEYYSNGKIKRKANYLNGDLHGMMEEYDENGKLKNKYEYKGGLLYQKV